MDNIQNSTFDDTADRSNQNLAFHLNSTFDDTVDRKQNLVFHLNEYLNNETLSHRRRKNFAPKELNTIISMVEENADLIYNKVSRNSKFISKQDFWIAVTHLVNESCNFVVGSNRDVKEVRRKWVTYQSEVKSKAREGACLLNPQEKRVYHLIQTHSPNPDVPQIPSKQELLSMLPGNSLLKVPAGLNTSGTHLKVPDLNISSTHLINPDLSISSTSNLGNEQSFMDVTSSTHSDSSSSTPVRTENGGGGGGGPVTEADKLLMNLCSQMIGGMTSNGDISAQMNGALKDIISGLPNCPNTAFSPTNPRSIPQNFTTPNDIISASSNHATPLPKEKVIPEPIPPIPSSPILPSPIVYPTPRNVISVQPHVQTPPKRARLQLDPPPHPSTNTDTYSPSRGSEMGTSDNSPAVALLRELVAQQRYANKIAEERLEVEKQRRDLETEKFEIEKARYEIEKERLCQEIISRKKS